MIFRKRTTEILLRLGLLKMYLLIQVNCVKYLQQLEIAAHSILFNTRYTF